MSQKRRDSFRRAQDMTLLDDTIYRYHVMVTNRSEPAQELVPFYLDRAIMENFIRETKYGLSLGRFPCQEIPCRLGHFQR